MCLLLDADCSRAAAVCCCAAVLHAVPDLRGCVSLGIRPNNKTCYKTDYMNTRLMAWLLWLQYQSTATYCAVHPLSPTWNAGGQYEHAIPDGCWLFNDHDCIEPRVTGLLWLQQANSCCCCSCNSYCSAVRAEPASCQNQDQPCIKTAKHWKHLGSEEVRPWLWGV